MIIFNKDALYIAILGALLILPVIILFGLNIVEKETVFLSSSWILFFASLIGLKMNLKGRLFFIFPTWVVTFIIAIYYSQLHFGILKGFIKNIFSVLILLILLIIIIGFLKERKKMQKLDIKKIKMPDGNLNNSNYWQEIKNLFFFPLYFNWNKNICEYNMKVITLLKENNIDLGDSYENFEFYINEIQEDLLKNKKQRTDFKKIDSLISNINYQVKLWQ